MSSEATLEVVEAPLPEIETVKITSEDIEEQEAVQAPPPAKKQKISDSDEAATNEDDAADIDTADPVRIAICISEAAIMDTDATWDCG